MTSRDRGRTQPRDDGSGQYNEALESSLERPGPATCSQFGHRRGSGGSHRQIPLLSTQLQKHPSTTARRGVEPRSARGDQGGGVGEEGGHHSLTLCRRLQLHHLEPLTRLQTGCSELDRDSRMEKLHLSHLPHIHAMRVTLSLTRTKTWSLCASIRPSVKSVHTKACGFALD